MKILLTGATGYIAQRLLPVLLEQGHEVICSVRDASRFNIKKYGKNSNLSVIEADFLDKASMNSIPNDIDAAYYLVHSMSAAGEFSSKEETSAHNFIEAIDTTQARQVVYLSGIVNDRQLSKH